MVQPVWYTKALALVGQPVGISFKNGTGTTGVLCRVRGTQLFVMEYLYHSQFATKHYNFNTVSDLYPFPGCSMPVIDPGVQRPAGTAVQPAAGIKRPSGNAAQPADSARRSGGNATQTADGARRPSGNAAQPADSARRSGGNAVQPAADASRSSGITFTLG